MTDRMKLFCSLCEQICAEPQLSVKTEITSGYLDQYRGSKGLLYRLLLPRDSGRKYHLGDKQLATLISRIVKKDEKAVLAQLHKDCGNDISEVAARVGMAGQTASTLTLVDVDDFLTRMSRLSTEDAQQAELAAFAARANPKELRWAVRMLKNDLKLGAGRNSLLSALHPKAVETFKTSDLHKMCEILFGEAVPGAGDAGGNGAGITATGGGMQLCHNIPVKPQLARPAKSLDDVVNRCPNGFYSEIKYDGERIQIHKHNGVFSFWSRSGKPMKPDKYEGLDVDLRTAFADTDTVIADGEILLIDTATSVPLPFGTLGKHKKAGFKDACTCIFLFDILEVDGCVVMSEPIDARRKLMKEKVRFVHNRVVASELVEIHGTAVECTAALQRHLNAVMKRGLEGLVVKDRKSPYAPAARHWIKLKKDYLEGMRDAADLVVLGRYYTYGGTSHTFLLGCFDPADKTWKTVCKCGNGFSDSFLEKLDADIKAKKLMREVKDGVVPSWLSCTNQVIPDMIVNDPKDSYVWEIIAAEFISQSPRHTAGLTATGGISMRHPRLLRVRKDKDWQTATDVPHLKTIVDASRTPLAIATANDADDDDADDPAVEALVKQRSIAMAADADADSDNDSACDAEPYSTPQRWAAQDPTPPPSPGLGPAPAAPAAAAAAAGGAAFPPPERCLEMIEYVEGDAVALVDAAHSSVRIIAHCAAEGGGWISRGAMGQISKLGDEPREEYESWNPALGVCQVVKVSDPYLAGGQLFVATLVCQTMSPTKGKPPNIDREGFEAAVSALMMKAREKRASVHIYKPMDASADWAANFNSVIVSALRPTDMKCTVYCKTAHEAATGNAMSRNRMAEEASKFPPSAAAAAAASAAAAAAAAKRPRDSPLPATLVASSNESSPLLPPPPAKKPRVLPGSATAAAAAAAVPAGAAPPDAAALLRVETVEVLSPGKNSASEGSVLQLAPLPSMGGSDGAPPGTPRASSTSASDDGLQALLQQSTVLLSEGSPPRTPRPSRPPAAAAAAAAAAATPAARRAAVLGPAMALDAVLQGKRVAVSGYSAALKAELGAQVERLGGVVFPAFGPHLPDIVVCETLTQLRERAVQQGVPVLRRSYLDDCIVHRCRCDAGAYSFDPLAVPEGAQAAAAAAPAAAAAAGGRDDSAPPTPIAPRGADGDDVESIASTAPAVDESFDDPMTGVVGGGGGGGGGGGDCSPVFLDCCIYLHREPGAGDDAAGAERLERYIISHDGDVVEDLTPAPTHIVTVSAGPALAQLVAKRPGLKHICVTPGWVWKSIEAECKLDLGAFTPF